MRLYRFPFSTNVERVALALAYKGLDAESVWIEPGDRSEVERVSGQPLVPVLVDGERVVVDSTEILRYFEGVQPEPRLWPVDPARAAELDIFLEWFNRVWKRPPNEIAGAGDRAKLGARMRAWLPWFEALLDGRDYLFGEEVTAADFVAFPFLKYALLLDEDDDELFHLVLREEQRDPGPRLTAWIQRIDALPRA